MHQSAQKRSEISVPAAFFESLLNFFNSAKAVLSDMNFISIAFRIFLAAIIGGIIGNERGKHGRAAGLRTHILVCLGAAMTTMLGFYCSGVLGFNSDPLRMGSQVVSGIGFLGAGTIMVRNRLRVTGLTTAAGLWTTACIGLSIGIGFYLGAILAFLVVVITMSILARLEGISAGGDNGNYYIEFASIEKAKAFYLDKNGMIYDINIVPAKSGIANHVGLEISLKRSEYRSLLVSELQSDEEIMIALPLRQ